MAYRISSGSGPRRVVAIVIAVLLNIGFFFGLQLGLIQKAISTIETQVAAVKQPPPPPPEQAPPPPPPPVEQPPPYVPPPDIVVATPTTSTNAIQQVTNTPPPPDRNPIGTDVTKPDYPPMASENCEEGITGMTLSIDEHGRVTDVKLRKSSGYPDLDNAAMAQAKHWRFAPARRAGKAVAYDYPVDLKWQLRDALTKRAYEECEKKNGGGG